MGKRLKKQIFVGLFMSIAVVGMISGCDSLQPASQNDTLQGSGIVEAEEVTVASELGGQVMEVLVKEGDVVTQGMPLLRLDGTVLEAEMAQAKAAYETASANLAMARAARESAQANLDAAQSGVTVADLQYQMELLGSRSAERSSADPVWDRTLPAEFELPVWYFEKPELLQAAEEQMISAREAYQIEKEKYNAMLADMGNEDIRASENRLVKAQAAFLNVQKLEEAVVVGKDQAYMSEFITGLMDSSKAELEAAQSAYDRLLTDDANSKILEGKARVAVLKENLEISVDQWNSLRTGEQSLTVQAAEALLNQAKKGVNQAQAGIAQADAGVEIAEKTVAEAQAALNLLEIQQDKLTVYAPLDGLVLVKSVNPGEILSPGVVALVVGKLDSLKITVFLPEDQYGMVSLGDTAQVSVDSFPGLTFDAQVIRISDKAEFTPRNVQTQEDRQTTVYAVELSVLEPDGKLKPGMPADVVFTQ